jgi:hypothetical protein
MSGSNQTNQNGIYGIKGEPSPSNTPGARNNLGSWVDNEGSFWIFGGYGYTSNESNTILSNCINIASSERYLNDVWRYDGNWTWISGSNTGNQNGNYGTKGVSSSSNFPGSRYNPVICPDNDVNIWMFGGGSNYNNGDS